jgi:hypothetical protein
MSKSLRYGKHSFPTSAGFTGSSGKVKNVKGYVRKAPSPGAAVMSGRTRTISQEDVEHGGKGPLLPGYKKGGLAKC